ncbi:hypothetical protein PI125_g25872 [Phytophthora idaei]|nr:hypothetical protein PI125_g25872 [Phytophthora idaei]
MKDVPEMVRAYVAQHGVACTSATTTADTRSVTTFVTTFIATFKLNAEITQLSRYTHSRVPGEVSLGETLCPRGGSANTQFQRELRTEYPPP